MRNTFIDLLNTELNNHFDNVPLEKVIAIADNLLAKNVLTVPCKAGDELWIIYPHAQLVGKVKVRKVTMGKNRDTIEFTDETTFTIWDKDYSTYFESVFPTREEAIKALKRLQQSKE